MPRGRTIDFSGLVLILNAGGFPASDRIDVASAERGAVLDGDQNVIAADVYAGDKGPTGQLVLIVSPFPVPAPGADLVLTDRRGDRVHPEFAT